MSDQGAGEKDITSDLRSRIESGEWSEGAQLPSEAQLIAAYGRSRHQIREALRELELEGYLERIQGRGSFIKSRHSKPKGFRFSGNSTVAISFPHYTSLYMRQIVDGAMHRLSEAGHMVVACNYQYDNDSEYALLQGIRDSGVAGLILWLTHCDDRSRKILNGLSENDFPIVFIDRYLTDMDIDYIVTENEQAAYDLTIALAERGHKKIGIISDPSTNTTSVIDRIAGFRRALKDKGLEDRPEWYVYAEKFPMSANDIGSLRKVMARQKRPTAFFAVHDLLAIPVYDELIDLGYQIGQDTDLAVIDDDHYFEDKGIPVLRKQQNGPVIGRRSAEMLLTRMQNPDSPQQSVSIDSGPVLYDEDFAEQRSNLSIHKGKNGQTQKSQTKSAVRSSKCARRKVT